MIDLIGEEDDDHMPVEGRAKRYLAYLDQMQERQRQVRIAYQVAWFSFGVTVLLVVLIGWFAFT